MGFLYIRPGLRDKLISKIVEYNMTQEIYETPTSNLKIQSEKTPTDASILLKIFTVVFALPNMAAGYLQQYVESNGNQPQAIGGACGALFFAGFIVLLFQVSSRFRNQRSRYKIFMWCHITLLILMVFSAVSAFLNIAR